MTLVTTNRFFTYGKKFSGGQARTFGRNLRFLERTLAQVFPCHERHFSIADDRFARALLRPV